VSSWIALVASVLAGVLAGVLVGVPVARWGWWSRIEDREWRDWTNFKLWFDGALFGVGAVGTLVMALVSLALTRWLVP